MADVIFKGSQTRGPSGAAEATIVFDNESGALPIDAAEVHVTRRVYRSGEGEYLINNQAVRLKDVKNLIRGTGIGIDAYSLIEQGKVDRMLQANAKDRRAIFEEAAGISRFKAKKVEAERRLARVQSNLTRLGDIVDEVGSRLKSIRGQASKAERYRQATEQLKQLRTQVAWADWEELSNELKFVEVELQHAVDRHQQLGVKREELQKEREVAEIQLQGIADEAQRVSSREVNACSRLRNIRDEEMDRVAITDLRSSIAKSLRRVRLLQTRAGSAAAELRDASERLQRYEDDLEVIRQRNATAEAGRDSVEREVEAVRLKRDEVQQQHLGRVRQVANLDAKRQRCEQRIAEAARQLGSLDKRQRIANEQLSDSEQRSKAAATKVDEVENTISEVVKEIELSEAKLQQSRRTLERRREEISALRIRLQGLSERYDVLQDLERRQEGISGGVKSILELLQRNSSPFADDIHGMVAEQLDVDIQVALLIDAALGERSQYLVVDGRVSKMRLWRNGLLSAEE